MSSPQSTIPQHILDVLEALDRGEVTGDLQVLGALSVGGESLDSIIESVVTEMDFQALIDAAIADNDTDDAQAVADAIAAALENPAVTTLTASGEISANGGVGRSSNGTLSLGTDANSTAVSIGGTDVVTTFGGPISFTSQSTVAGGGNHGTLASTSTFYGYDARGDGSPYSTALGHNTQVLGWGGTTVGASSWAAFAAVSVGAFCTASNYAISMGYEHHAPQGEFRVGFGGAATPITRTIIGHGDATALTPAELRIGNSDAQGENVAGAPLRLTASCGTGSGAGGEVSLEAAPAGGAGSSLNALVKGVRWNGTGLGFYGVTPVARQSAAGMADLDAVKAALVLLGLFDT